MYNFKATNYLRITIMQFETVSPMAQWLSFIYKPVEVNQQAASQPGCLAHVGGKPPRDLTYSRSLNDSIAVFSWTQSTTPSMCYADSHLLQNGFPLPE